MKTSMKIKVLLPLLATAQISFGVKKYPERMADQIILVACAKGKEACERCKLSMKHDGDNITEIAKCLKDSKTPFEDSSKIDSARLEKLSAEEKEVAIIGFVTLLMLQDTGIALKSAIDAGLKLAASPNSPDYFNKFVDTVKSLKEASKADEIMDKLEAAKESLPKELIKNLEAIEKEFEFADPNAKLRAIKALIRNNKNYTGIAKALSLTEDQKNKS
jgi:hypothetical protein